MATDNLTKERIALNQSTFRSANENIEAAADGMALTGAIPFICECADRRCTEIVRLTVDEYAEVRSHPRRFFNAPGHEAISVAAGAGKVVDDTGSYVVVEKIDVAGRVAEAEYGELARGGGDD